MRINNKTKICLTALALCALAVLGRQQLDKRPGAQTVRPVAVEPTDADMSAVAQEPLVGTATAPGRVGPNAHVVDTEAGQALAASVQTWFDNVRNYQQEDRATFMEARLEELERKGPASVFEIERQLAGTSVYEREKRAAAFHALTRLGKSLADSRDPRAKPALDAIQRLAKAELELPALIEPDPMADVYALPEAAQHELLHQGILVERDGELLQPTAPNKLPVIRMLRNLGGDQSLTRLKALAKLEDNPPGVRFAVEQAIASL